MNPKNKLAEMSIRPLLYTMAVPLMLSLLIQSLYNIVDSIFVAQKEEKNDFQRGWFQDCAWIGYELYVDGFLFDPCIGK